MKKIWWILCSVGVFLIIRSVWMQMTGFDKWIAVLWMSSSWLQSLLTDLQEYLEAA